eukprot:scaffold304_cov409-Prasinococcus_capsulatus_cf.AAC.7
MLCSQRSSQTPYRSASEAATASRAQRYVGGGQGRPCLDAVTAKRAKWPAFLSLRRDGGLTPPAVCPWQPVSSKIKELKTKIPGRAARDQDTLGWRGEGVAQFARDEAGHYRPSRTCFRRGMDPVPSHCSPGLATRRLHHPTDAILNLVVMMLRGRGSTACHSC